MLGPAGGTKVRTPPGGADGAGPGTVDGAIMLDAPPGGRTVPGWSEGAGPSVAVGGAVAQVGHDPIVPNVEIPPRQGLHGDTQPPHGEQGTHGVQGVAQTAR